MVSMLPFMMSTSVGNCIMSNMPTVTDGQIKLIMLIVQAVASSLFYLKDRAIP